MVSVFLFLMSSMVAYCDVASNFVSNSLIDQEIQSLAQYASTPEIRRQRMVSFIQDDLGGIFSVPNLPGLMEVPEIKKIMENPGISFEDKSIYLCEIGLKFKSKLDPLQAQYDIFHHAIASRIVKANPNESCTLMTTQVVTHQPSYVESDYLSNLKCNGQEFSSASIYNSFCSEIRRVYASKYDQFLSNLCDQSSENRNYFRKLITMATRILQQQKKIESIDLGSIVEKFLDLTITDSLFTVPSSTQKSKDIDLSFVNTIALEVGTQVMSNTFKSATRVVPPVTFVAELLDPSDLGNGSKSTAFSVHHTGLINMNSAYEWFKPGGGHADGIEKTFLASILAKSMTTSASNPSCVIRSRSQSSVNSAANHDSYQHGSQGQKSDDTSAGAGSPMNAAAPPAAK